MRVALFTDEIGWHTRELQAALRARGAHGRCVDLADVAIDTTRASGLAIPGFAGLPDAAIVRGIAGGSFEQVTRRLGVLHALVAQGVPVYNRPRAIERAVDKSATSLLLHTAGLPTPPAWALESAEAAEALVAREAAAGRALVLKPLFGSQGKGLLRVGQVEGRFVPLPAGLFGARSGGHGRMVYLQRCVPPPVQPAHDWRVLVIGGRARAAMRRLGSGWVHNMAQGARSEAAPLTPELARLAEGASAVLGLDYAGVDLIPSRRGAQILEVNGVAAWHALQRVAPLRIAAALVDDLLDRVCA